MSNCAELGADAVPEVLGGAVGTLPALAGRMREDGAHAQEIAQALARVIGATTARAAAFAESAMIDAGCGTAPAPWCFLVLGSTGRGECLLAFEQESAIVHAGKDNDDPWYCELARRVALILERAGVRLHRNGIVASSGAHRHSLNGLREDLQRWAARPAGAASVDYASFWDFEAVHGDEDLAWDLREATAAIGRDPRIALRFARDLDTWVSPLGVFGGLRIRDGRFDLQTGGLEHLAGGIRALSARWGIVATATRARLDALAQLAAISKADAGELADAHELCLELILDQELRDAADAIPPSARIAPAQLSPDGRHRLRGALRTIGAVQIVARGNFYRAVG